MGWAAIKNDNGHLLSRGGFHLFNDLSSLIILLFHVVNDKYCKNFTLLNPHFNLLAIASLI